jgi:hypothetical protein
MKNIKAFFIGIFFFLSVCVLIGAVDKTVYDQAKFQAFISKITGSLNFDSNTLVVDAANNRVAIGTSSPTAGTKLDVNGVISGRSQIRSENQYSNYVWKNTAAAADEKIWQVLTGRAANSLSFESVNDAESVANSWMTVERSGATPTNLYFSNVRVGVGDSAPGQALTVKSAADSLQAVGIYDSRTQAANVGGSMAIGGRYLDGSTGLTTAVEHISYILV